MTDKELRHLRRAELLEMLLAQVVENQNLKMRLDELQTQFDNRQIMIDKAGSIAEASLQLNGVFQAAEAAAAQYLENIQRLSGEEEAACQPMEEEARKKAEAIRNEADAYSRQVRAEADAYSQQVRAEADQYQKKIAKEVQDLLQEQDGLSSLFCSYEGKQKT